MKYLLMILLIGLFIIPVQATEPTAPTVPEEASVYMPENTESFSEGLWYVIRKGIELVNPQLHKVMGLCLSLVALALLVSITGNFTQEKANATDLAGCISAAVLLLSPSGSLIDLGIETVRQIGDYGKLLLPVLTTALAAQGGVNTSAALYAGTSIFSAILSSLLHTVLVPLIYVYLCISVVISAFPNDYLQNIRSFIKWIMTWTLKIILYVFTGYISITGVIGGGVDASAIKAAKLTLSGVIPVVGSIISDASEAILVGAGLVKNGIGVYGLLAVLSIIIGPFIKFGIQYLLLKVTGAICKTFGTSKISGLIQDFSSIMGFLLGMIGTNGLLLLISIVCYMKGGV